MNKFFFECKVATMYAAGAIGAMVLLASVFFLGTPLGIGMALFGLLCLWFSSDLSKTLTEELDNDQDS